KLREKASEGWQKLRKVPWDQPVRWWKAQPRAQRREETYWWRRTLRDVGIAYGILLPFELIFNGGKVGAFGVHPHPYWLIILPMAAARGAGAALVAAAVGTFLHTLGAIGRLHTTEVQTLLDYTVMLEPLLFFGVGFLVGDFRDVAEARYREIKRKRHKADEKVDRLYKEREVLAEANRLLEKRLVDQTTQFGNLVVAAQRMESSDRTEVFELALDLVDEHCGANASVMLVLDSGSVDFLCYRGWTEGEVGTRLSDARDSAFVQRALDDGTQVNGFLPGESPPEKGPIAVAPLFDGEGVVRALLCLDDVPPFRLNSSTLSIFFGIAEWISAAMARLDRRSETPDPRKAFTAAPEGDAWIGDRNDLGERLRIEYERLARYGVPTSLLLIHASEYTDTTAEGRKKLDRYMVCHFTGSLRASDNLYRFGYPGCYVLVLAGTNSEGAEVVRKRLLRRVRYRPSPVVGAVEVEVTAPDAEAPDLVSLASRVAATFRERSPLKLDSECPVRVPAQTKLGSLDDFMRRLKIETSLALRNGLDLHVLGFFGKETQGDPDLFARHLHEVASDLLRQTDAVFRVTPSRCAVVLPATDAEQSETLGRRILEALAARDPDAAYGTPRVRLLGLGPSHPDPRAFLFEFEDEDEDKGDSPGAVAELQPAVLREPEPPATLKAEAPLPVVQEAEPRGDEPDTGTVTPTEPRAHGPADVPGTGTEVDPGAVQPGLENEKEQEGGDGTGTATELDPQTVEPDPLDVTGTATECDPQALQAEFEREADSETEPTTQPAADEEEKEEDGDDFPTKTEIFNESDAFGRHGSDARRAVPLPDPEPEPEPEEDHDEEDTDSGTVDEMSDETGTGEDTDVDAPIPEPPTLRDAAAGDDEATDTGTVGEFDQEDES
ncbi:MAG: hypothetical protein ACE10D_12530, partial [Planctomycetota bacterium]